MELKESEKRFQQADSEVRELLSGMRDVFGDRVSNLEQLAHFIKDRNYTPTSPYKRDFGERKVDRGELAFSNGESTIHLLKDACFIIEGEKVKVGEQHIVFDFQKGNYFAYLPLDNIRRYSLN